jgi:hypothetical protein
MRQVQPETLPKNSMFSSCLQNIKLKTPNSGQFSHPLPNIVSFLFRLEFGLGHVLFLLIYLRFGSHIVEDFEVP